MLTVVLALGSAAAFGIADFAGGVLTRRASLWQVTLLMQSGATATILALHIVQPAHPSVSALSWGALAGLANGIGTIFLYRGLAYGRMGVVAPSSGAFAASLPVLAGVLLGERPTVLAWLGVLLAIPGIWLVARDPRQPGDAEASGGPSGLADGLIAGACFGILFIALAQIRSSEGWLPLALAEAVAAACVVVVAVLIGQTWYPRGTEALPALGIGVVVGLAMAAFLAATHSGLLSIAAVLSSLYPGVTVLLAAVLLREPMHRLQLAGLALCGAAVAMVAAG